MRELYRLIQRRDQIKEQLRQIDEEKDFKLYVKLRQELDKLKNEIMRLENDSR